MTRLAVNAHSFSGSIESRVTLSESGNELSRASGSTGPQRDAWSTGQGAGGTHRLVLINQCGKRLERLRIASSVEVRSALHRRRDGDERVKKPPR
jgi:hypothetical protein